MTDENASQPSHVLDMWHYRPSNAEGSLASTQLQLLAQGQGSIRGPRKQLKRAFRFDVWSSVSHLSDVPAVRLTT